MIAEKIKICDDCKKVIADRKCFLCEKDLCDSCNGDIIWGTLTFRNNANMEMMKGKTICYKCKDSFIELLKEKNIPKDEFFDEDFKKEIEEKTKEYIKGRLFIEKL